MQSFAERKLLDDLVTLIFKLKARGKLSETEADHLIGLKKMLELGEGAELFRSLRQAFINPGKCGEDPEIRGLILQTMLSSDLQNQEDLDLLVKMVDELIEAADQA